MDDERCLTWQLLEVLAEMAERNVERPGQVARLPLGGAPNVQHLDLTALHPLREFVKLDAREALHLAALIRPRLHGPVAEEAGRPV